MIPSQSPDPYSRSVGNKRAPSTGPLGEGVETPNSLRVALGRVREALSPIMVRG